MRCAIIALTLSLTTVTQADTLVLLPSEVTLTGREASQRLVLERADGRALRGQVSEGVTFASSNQKVVRIEQSRALPVGNGKATITARHGKQSASIEVTVVGFEKPHAWSFRNHVQPVLTKTGCNMGACHGAASGKKGFKLTLRGYDPVIDFDVLTRQSRGRRVVPSDPGRSLFLTKPTGALPHKGGIRFKTDSLEYRVLAEWLASGRTPPRDDDPRLVRLEVLPRQVVLREGDRQQMLLLAHFSDGHTEDVTQWVKFESTNSVVASVDDAGLVTIDGAGEGAISAWYLSQTVIAGLTVPYDNPVAPEVFTKAKRVNFVDELVLKKLESLKLPPSPSVTDGEFLRRAYLDTIGVLPSVEEARAFLADASPEKRTRLVDMLLARPEFVDYWSNKWSDLLLVSGKRLRPKALKAYYGWIRKQVEQNTPWDEFVREIVTAKGSAHESGAANFYALHQDPLDMAETVSMAFLGMSINCARCHDHPLEKWTNDDYYAMANMFSRVRGKGWGGDYRSGDGNRDIFSATEGELIQPRTGRVQPPKPLDGEALVMHASQDRRVPLADWLTAPENPYFSRAIVNRVWANFMGVGLVEKVDDLRLTNPPSNEELLAALADDLVKNDYDLKSLMRLILTSDAYQRSSRSVPGNEADSRYYARFYPRRLRAEILLDAMSQVTGAPTQFKEATETRDKFNDLPLGTRAVQLPDPTVASYFLETFGRPDRLITCECERSNEPSMVQVLHIVNGETLNSKLKADKSRVAGFIEAKTDDATVIDELYLAALTRFPTADEKQRILDVFAETDGKDRRPLLEDLCWGLLSSREFLFNH